MSKSKVLKNIGIIEEYGYGGIKTVCVSKNHGTMSIIKAFGAKKKKCTCAEDKRIGCTCMQDAERCMK